VTLTAEQLECISEDQRRVNGEAMTRSAIENPVRTLTRIDRAIQKIDASAGGETMRPAAALDLRITKNGVIPDEENVLRILKGDPHLQGVVRFDEFASEIILARPITRDEYVGERGVPRSWTDADTVTLQTYIQRYIVPRMGREKIEAVVAMFARQYCAFHPVRDYLQSLEWDGVRRLDNWLREYMGANEQPAEYVVAVGSRFLIAAVARIMEPGCQADSAIVLEGPQGIYKSTALRVLAGDEYFSDSLPADLSHKDARDHLRGKWIVELSELAQFRRGEIETIKAFISRRYEQYRPSYGRHEIKFPRQCVFAGTTNADEYLVDQTGNRRFWVVSCTGVQLGALTRDRDQLWAEAVVRYRNREPWHLSEQIAHIAAAEAESRVTHDPWTPHVASILEDRIPPIIECTPGEILGLMDLSESERHKSNAARVAQILRDLGWRKGRRDRTRGQIYTRGVKR
jgi:putative DNA primase/helicase